ncbi:Uncharacterised protein at_DN2088 [Pycnogonum litorale]
MNSFSTQETPESQTAPSKPLVRKGQRGKKFFTSKNNNNNKNKFKGTKPVENPLGDAPTAKDGLQLPKPKTIAPSHPLPVMIQFYQMNLISMGMVDIHNIIGEMSFLLIMQVILI